MQTRVRSRRAARMMGVLLLAGLVSTALAATKTWTGGDSNDSNWTSNDNWSGVIGAGADDDLVFPASAARKANVNGFSVNTNFGSLTFGGTGYSITGSQIFLGANGTLGGIDASIPAAGTFTFVPNIILGKTQTFSSNGAAPYTLNGVVNLNSFSLILSGTGDARLNGTINGTGLLFQSGTGTSILNGNSPSFGTTRINSGTLQVDGTIGAVVHAGGTLSGSGTVGNVPFVGGPARTIAPGSGPGAAGILTAGIVAMSNTTLAIDLNGTTPGTEYDRLATVSINLNNAPLSVSLGFTPGIAMAANTPFVIVTATGGVTGQFASGTSINVDGVPFSIEYGPLDVILIPMASTRTWSGAGGDSNWTTAANWVEGAPIAGDDLVFPSAAARKTNTNNYANNTHFNSIAVNGAGYAIGGNGITLGNGISENAPAGGSALNLGITLGQAQTFAANGNGFSLGGALKLNGFALTLAGTHDIAIAGVVSGAGGITRIGPGTAILTNSNTYGGGTLVTQGGELIVTGTTGAITLASSGGRLAGSGTVGAVIAQGAGSPGRLAPGAGTNGSGTAVLNVTGSVTLAATTTFGIEIGGLTAGLQYDRLNVTGTIDLGGASLQGHLINAFVPGAGNQFAIIQSSGALSGQFAQGGTVTIDGVGFSVAYGPNSVVLTANGAAPLPDLTVTKTHVGNFAQGQVGAIYTATVTNAGAGAKPAAATVSLTDTPPAALTVTAMGGTGWTCTILPICTRSDVLPAGQSYPPVTIAVTVAGNATSPQVNSVSVSTAATESNAGNNSAISSTIIDAGSQFPVSVSKNGSGSGIVAAADGGIVCGMNCTHSYVGGTGIELSAAPAAGSVFTGFLGACTGTTDCNLTITGAIAVSATFALAPIGAHILDVDANTTFDALTDGLLAVRYLLGLTGTDLASGAIGTGAGRGAAGPILDYLNDIRPYLDIDGNGVVDALTDGLLIIRSLFGFSGDGLIQGAIGLGAKRASATDIQNYLTTLK